MIICCSYLKKSRTKTNLVSHSSIKYENLIDTEIEWNFRNIIFRNSFGDAPETGQHCAPQRICGKTIFDGNCVSTHGADCTTGEPRTNCERNPTLKCKSVTSAYAAASLPLWPGCAEHCSAVLQPDSLLPPEARMADYTSAPSPSLLSAAEKPDPPLHGGNTDFIYKYLTFGSDGLRLTEIRLDAAPA